MDRLATRTDPLLRQESYQYDASGNLARFTDRKGQITQYQYDLLNRRSQTIYGDGSSLSFAYDSVGRFITLTDTNSGQIQYGYDNLNRLVQETTAQGVVNYGYDALGRRTSMAVNGQSPVSYAYDANSRLTTLMALSQVYSLTYDPAGRRAALSYPNGVTTSYSYDADSRVLNILHQAGISTIENIGYTYDMNGNRTSMTRGNGSATNLPQALQAAYDAANEMNSFNNPTPNLTYDNNGNLLSDGTKTYTWNARNQLVAISGNVTASFSYDAVGRRVSKTINGVRTDYQYDGNDIIAEIGGGAVGATYVRSRKIDEPFARITSSGTEFYHTDALGSVFALTNASGVTAASYTYDPFGNTAQTGISSNPFQYTGRENDGTGLYYYRARYYSPTLQRFISQDPIGLLGGLNSYSYVGGNPMEYNDPSGLCKNPCDASLPSNSDVLLLSQLIFAEATRGRGITSVNSNSEMAAIAYTVINRSSYLQENPQVSASYFGASDSSIQGVITPSQFGSLSRSDFGSISSPELMNTSTALGQANCTFLKLAIATAQGALAGYIGDPFEEEGGVYGFRTAGHGGPGGSFYAFPTQISGSGNAFYGLP